MDTTVNESRTRTPSAEANNEGIIWLASYPKSGNTWFRILLRDLMSGDDGPVKLDKIGFSIASCRALFDDVAGVDSSDLSHDEIDHLRPKVYEHIVAEAKALPVYLKTHDAYTYLPNGQPLMSQQATAGAVYVIRNPLDVAVSFAFHSRHGDFDRTIAKMGSICYAMCSKPGKLGEQIRQQMPGWSGHVRSWAEAEIPLHVMRYEDMQLRPIDSFTAAILFAGMDYGKVDVERSLERTRFENLQKIERKSGFREKRIGCKMFFRSGKIGSWREHLNRTQVRQIISDHHEVMQDFGYLTYDGEPVF